MNSKLLVMCLNLMERFWSGAACDTGSLVRRASFTNKLAPNEARMQSLLLEVHLTAALTRAGRSISPQSCIQNVSKTDPTFERNSEP